MLSRQVHPPARSMAITAWGQGDRATISALFVFRSSISSSSKFKSFSRRLLGMKRLIFAVLSALVLSATVTSIASANAGTSTCPDSLGPGVHCVGAGH